MNQVKLRNEKIPNDFCLRQVLFHIYVLLRGISLNVFGLRKRLYLPLCSLYLKFLSVNISSSFFFYKVKTSLVLLIAPKKK